METTVLKTDFELGSYSIKYLVDTKESARSFQDRGRQDINESFEKKRIIYLKEKRAKSKE